MALDLPVRPPVRPMLARLEAETHRRDDQDGLHGSGENGAVLIDWSEHDAGKSTATPYSVAVTSAPLVSASDDTDDALTRSHPGCLLLRPTTPGRASSGQATRSSRSSTGVSGSTTQQPAPNMPAAIPPRSSAR